MDPLITRLFLFLVAASYAFAPRAHAAQPVVKTITHDASAHNSWVNGDRDKWRKKLTTKHAAKTSSLVKVQTR